MGLLERLGAAVARATKGARTKKNDKSSRALAGIQNNDACEYGERFVFEHCALSPDQVHDLRSLYVSAKGVCALLDQADVCESMGYPGRTLEELFENDVVRYLIYLSAKDDELTKAEIEFLNAIFDCDRTVGEWTIRAIRLGVTSPAVATEVPLSFQMLSQAGMRCGVDAGEVFVPVFDRLAAALVIADGEETAEERDCAAAYLALLTQYLESGQTELVQPDYPIFLN